MRQLTVFFIMISAFFLQACQPSEDYAQTRLWMERNNKLKVLCTTGMIEDIVSQVGGEHVDVITLIKGDMNPHSYQLVKGDDEKLNFAEVIFCNGLGLEHGPSLQHYLHESEKAVSLGNLIAEQNPDRILKVEGQTDPHIWMDISLWKETIPHVVRTLSEKDPEHAKDFQKNALQISKSLEAADAEIREMMHHVPKSRRYLITSHDAFNYFCRSYLVEDEDDWNIRCAAPEGLAPESQLSTADIQEIIDHAKKYNITVIFPESNVNKDSLNKIVSAGREKGLHIRVADTVLYADAMGPKGSDGDSYIKMVRHNARFLSKSLMEEKE